MHISKSNVNIKIKANIFKVVEGCSRSYNNNFIKIWKLLKYETYIEQNENRNTT